MGNTIESINDIADAQHRQGHNSEYPFFITMKTGRCYEKVKMSAISFTRLHLALQNKRSLSPYESQMVNQNRVIASTSNAKNLDVEVVAWIPENFPVTTPITIQMKRDNHSNPPLPLSQKRAQYLKIFHDFHRLDVHRAEIDALNSRIIALGDSSVETTAFEERFARVIDEYLEALQKKAAALKTMAKL